MEYRELPHLADDRVMLRPIEASDLADWFAYLSEPVVFEHTSWDVQSAGELSDYVWGIEPLTPASRLRAAIARRSDGRLVGTAGFHSVSPANRTAEIAYDLSPSMWGQGVATEVCKCLVEWAHREAGIVRVQATTLVSNSRSQAVLERSGFQREGLLRSYRMVRGRPGDFWMFSHVMDAGA